MAGIVGVMTTSLTARTPDDLLAMVPVVFGFVPTESIAMLTFGGRETFHARVDLPPPGRPTAEVVDLLREPAVRHGVRRVVFVLYSAESRAAERVAARLVRGFRERGIDVVDVIRADGRCWFPLLRDPHDATGTPYDVTCHPFLAQSVVDGRVTHRSRTELAATLAADPGRAAAVAAVVAADRGLAPPGRDWLMATVRRHLAEGTSPDDADAARLLRAVDVEAGRQAAGDCITRAMAGEHQRFWADLVRRAPDDLVAGAASVLALAAWASGHGALAWCAIDRALAQEPDHPLAGLVADLLMGAVPPTAWEEERPEPAA